MKGKRLLMLMLPYVLLALLFTKLPQAWRLATGATFPEKLLHISEGFAVAIASPLPSLNPIDLLIGASLSAALRVAVYVKGKNAKKYRHNREYGSARCGA